MNVLVITGDRSFVAGNPRFDTQASTVEYFEVVYWGRGALFPKVHGTSFDVVTTQDPFLRAAVGWFFAWRFKAQLHIQVHSDIRAQSLWKRALGRFMLRRADSIRVVSQKIKNQVLRIGARAPISVLPVFVDIERFQKMKRIPDAQPLILWIGRFEEEKDPLFAVEVFRRLHEKHRDVRLIMLGTGSLEEKVHQAASDLPIEFPGWQDTIPFLSRAHVVLCTSHAESWGASIVEALAAGVPVVAPDVGIAREAGALVVPRQELADAVWDVIRSLPYVELKLNLLSKEAWATAWRNALS